MKKPNISNMIKTRTCISSFGGDVSKKAISDDISPKLHIDGISNLDCVLERDADSEVDTPIR